MRVDTSGMMVISLNGLFGARLCLLAVFVFVCSIDRSNSTDTGAKDTIKDPIRHHPSSLTDVQLKSAYTIEFDFRHIDKKNRTAVRIAYQEARRKILDRLNRNKHKASSPTTSATVAADTTVVATTITTAAETTAAVTTAADTTTTTPTPTSAITTLAETTATTNPTTIATTSPTEPTTITAALETTQTTLAVETTTETPTTVLTTTTPAGTPPINRRRKRQQNSEGNKSTVLTDDDLAFIDNGIEIDEDGTLRISFFLNTTEFSEDELLKALNELETEENGFKEIAPVIDVYKGLPPEKSAMADIRVWLPILFAIIVLIIIFIIGYCCWKTTSKKEQDVEQQKIVPKQDSKPSTSNGHAHPRILDDNSGWLIPYEQFGSEQKI